MKALSHGHGVSDFSNAAPAAPADDLSHHSRSRRSERVHDHTTLTKPRITVMVVITAFIGFAMGAMAQGHWSALALVAALAGTAWSCMGASAFNQIYERRTDGLMQRTRNRPLPSGRLSPREAMITGIAFSIIGVGFLWAGANWLACALSAFTILSYALVYTPMKRVNSWSTLIGAVPGAMPPVIGYAAATGRMDLAAWLLFAVMFAWQMPHFFAIGWLYREDYARAGLPILPVIDPEGRRTRRHIVGWAVVMLVVAVLPTLLHVTGWAALIVGGLCSLYFLALSLQLMRKPTRAMARRVFLASLVYLPIVLMVILLDTL